MKAKISTGGLFLLGLLFIIFNVNAQTSQWAKNVVANEKDASNGIVTIDSGHVKQAEISKIISTPSLSPQPTIASTGLTISGINCTDVQLNWTSGNGSKRIVVARVISSSNASPNDKQTYFASSIFGSGDNLGNGNFVVYNGSGNSVVVTGLTPGTQYSFSIFEYNGSYNNTNYNTANFATSSFLVTPFTLNIALSQPAICTGSQMTLTASGGTTYQWSPGNGLSSTTGASVIASPANTTSYTVNGTNNQGCHSVKQVVVNVNALPTVNYNNAMQVCERSSSVSLSGESPSGGIFTGTGVSGNIFNPGSGHTGINVITYTFTDANGCRASDTSSVYINPLPLIMMPTYQSVCVDAQPVSLSGVSPSGGTFSGTGVSGSAFNPHSGHVGKNMITYTYTDSKGCTASDTTSIHVNSLPVIAMPASQTVCVDAQPVSLSSVSPSGGTFSGTGVSGITFNPHSGHIGINVISYTYTDSKGCTASDTSSIRLVALPIISMPVFQPVCIDAQPVTLSGAQPVGGIYSGNGVNAGVFDPLQTIPGINKITYTYTDNHGCQQSDSADLMVSSRPTVTIGPLHDVCRNYTPFTLIVGSPPGGTYSGPGVSANVFNPNVAGNGTHYIIYNYADQGGCSNSTTTAINVIPLPTVAFQPLFPVCINNQPVNLTGGIPVGGYYSGFGVNNNIFDPSVAGVGNYIITYSFEDSSGCSSDIQQTLQVKPLPSVSLVTPDICKNGSPLVLTGGLPVGGIYSGQNVVNGVFDPIAVSAGNYAVNYSVTDNNNCTGSIVSNLKVIDPPHPNLGPDTTLCDGSVLYLDGGADYSSYHWSNGYTTRSINIGHGSQSTVIYSVMVTDSFNCSGTDTITITFTVCASVEPISSDYPWCYIYPNPFSYGFTMFSEKKLFVQIYDVSGRLVEEDRCEGSMIAGHNLSPGVYFVTVNFNDQKKTFKIIKSE